MPRVISSCSHCLVYFGVCHRVFPVQLWFNCIYLFTPFELNCHLLSDPKGKQHITTTYLSLSKVVNCCLIFCLWDCIYVLSLGYWARKWNCSLVYELVPHAWLLTTCIEIFTVASLYGDCIYLLAFYDDLFLPYGSAHLMRRYLNCLVSFSVVCLRLGFWVNSDVRVLFLNG